MMLHNLLLPIDSGVLFVFICISPSRIFISPESASAATATLLIDDLSVCLTCTGHLIKLMLLESEQVVLIVLYLTHRGRRLENVLILLQTSLLL